MYYNLLKITDRAISSALADPHHKLFTMTSLHQTDDLRIALKEREAEIKLLQDTFQLIASELNLEKVFDTIARRALQLVDAETLLIPILDDNKTTYTYRAGAGKSSDEIVGESLPIDFGVCGWVWKHKKPWWRGVLNELNETERNQWEKEAGTLILVPLQGRYSFLGGIAAINKKDGLDFSRRDLNTLSLFAGIVSIAIENAIAVTELENTQKTLLDHQHKLERLNKQYTESNIKIEQLSLYDTLTGLPNRTLFQDRINTQLLISEQQKLILGIVLIDISNFKSLNDALGIEAGDQILIEFCKRIDRHVQANETFSRLGSDEFILIIPATSLNKTIKKVHQLINEIENNFYINDSELSVSARFGIAMYPAHGKQRTDLLKNADIALDIAKKQNTPFHIYDMEKDQADSDHVSLSIDIQRAFSEAQFELYYQPKIDIKTGALLSAEALGRWKHPEKGFIAPAIFIDALEQYNAIDRYTYEAIDMVANNINKWSRAGYNIKIAINISTKTLMNSDFIHQIEQRLTDFTVSSRLIFEITESLFLSDHDYIYESLTRLRTLGIELSIDDFGTGYSSLSRLRHLPVNEIKIDQSFIRDMDENIDDQIIVKSIIDLAHNLGMTVTAEGVETKNILNQLNKLGCDIAQGYYFNKALSAKEFESLLKNGA